MFRQFDEFLSVFNKLHHLLIEYDTSYIQGRIHFSNLENTEKQQLLRKLNQIENEYVQQKRELLLRVQSHLQKLRKTLQDVENHEQLIQEKRFQKLKSEYGTLPQIQLSTDTHYTEDEIVEQFENSICSINRIINSKMPKSLIAICSFFNPKFRKKKYERILRNKDKLNEMLSVAERDVQTVCAEIEQNLSSHATTEISGISASNYSLLADIQIKRQEYYKQLKLLLLNGFEVILRKPVFLQAEADLISFLSFYVQNQDVDVSFRRLLIGILKYRVSVNDDGTADYYFSKILGKNIYNNQELLIPIELEPSFVKPLCVQYYSDYNEKVFSLFKNYALQMMKIFSNIGISVYLVDKTNVGSKYSSFTSFEQNDENKRVNIIRTVEDIKKLLDEASKYIIETNSMYLKNQYSTVSEYNDNSVIKREIKAIFISNIGELDSNELIAKLETVIRNGNRCGVYTFVGISSDELQVSGIVSQVRVSEISNIVDLCDVIYMNSNFDLSFGNGTFQFYFPPEINQNIEQSLIQKAVFAERQGSKVPLKEHLISEEEFFTFNCDSDITIPIGIDTQGNEYCVDFNMDTSYMLVGGDPAGGKSSLMHTLILQTITRYSPDRVQLYLADLKDGAEFDNYLRKGIISINAVLNRSEDEDMATSFLMYIKSLVDERKSVFDELIDLSGRQIRNIEQFYEVNNELHLVPNMPRILLIIDEFQSLYDGDRQKGEITNWLVRMCRTVGICIIMSSQRAQRDGATNNSFSGQTKDYFKYRIMFKCPYSSARQIVSEQCSDTGKENPAVRQAQTLKKGQAIVNSNMGATESDNNLVQCYYPDNDCIDYVCDKLVAIQGKKKIIELNPNISPVLDKTLFTATKGYVLGVSNRLHYDLYSDNNDEILDDNVVTIQTNVTPNVISVGTDDRVKLSSFWVILSKLLYIYGNKLKVNILIQSSELIKIKYLDMIPKSILTISNSVNEFIEIIRQSQDDCFSFNLLVNPYKFTEIQKEQWSTNISGSISVILSILEKRMTFNMVWADDAKLIKEKCSYLDTELKLRVVSVGNTISIKSAISNDLWEKVTDEVFNTVQSNVVKAYYYNKNTDKIGHMRMFDPVDIIKFTDFSIIPETVAQESIAFSGLVGN